MFNPTRDQARQMFFEVWRKYRLQEPLAGIESLVLEVILQHPEYHDLLANPAQYLERDYPPELGETNPFLHMSLHLSIHEQRSIDQPSGIGARYAQVLAQVGDPHSAQHALMDCLAEMIWQAQRNQTAPNPGIYFDCLDHKIKRKPQ